MVLERETPPEADSDDRCKLFAALGKDMLNETFGRLPTKSAISCKSVSKEWRSFISGDEFRSLHISRQKPQPSLILCTRTSKFYYFNPVIDGDEKPKMVLYTFPLLIPEPKIPKILSSCNGLMFLEFENADGIFYFVYNPTTRESRKISVKFDYDYPCKLGFSLAFDPSNSPHYKIVCVRGRKDESADADKSYRFEVYDSEYSGWELFVESFIYAKDMDFSYGVHCNSSIYWKKDDAILCFDLDKKEVRDLDHPNVPWPERNRGSSSRASQLQESNGHLYLFVVDKEGESVALWELQEDGHWSPYPNYHHQSRERVSGESMFGKRGSTSLLRFIGGSDGGALVTHVSGKIRVFSFVDESFKELVDLTDQSYYNKNNLQFKYQDVHHFGESLAPV